MIGLRRAATCYTIAPAPDTILFFFSLPSVHSLSEPFHAILVAYCLNYNLLTYIYTHNYNKMNFNKQIRHSCTYTLSFLFVLFIVAHAIMRWLSLFNHSIQVFYRIVGILFSAMYNILKRFYVPYYCLVHYAIVSTEYEYRNFCMS